MKKAVREGSREDWSSGGEKWNKEMLRGGTGERGSRLPYLNIPFNLNSKFYSLVPRSRLPISNIPVPTMVFPDSKIWAT